MNLPTRRIGIHVSTTMELEERARETWGGVGYAWVPYLHSTRLVPGDRCQITVTSEWNGATIVVDGRRSMIFNPPPALREAMMLVAALFLPYSNITEEWLRSFSGRAACYAIAVSSFAGPVTPIESAPDLSLPVRQVAGLLQGS